MTPSGEIEVVDNDFSHVEAADPFVFANSLHESETICAGSSNIFNFVLHFMTGPALYIVVKSGEREGECSRSWHSLVSRLMPKLSQASGIVARTDVF